MFLKDKASAGFIILWHDSFTMWLRVSQIQKERKQKFYTFFIFTFILFLIFKHTNHFYSELHGSYIAARRAGKLINVPRMERINTLAEQCPFQLHAVPVLSFLPARQEFSVELHLLVSCTKWREITKKVYSQLRLVWSLGD
jgi:hypothetical protein